MAKNIERKSESSQADKIENEKKKRFISLIYEYNSADDRIFVSYKLSKVWHKDIKSEIYQR